ncbi:MAG: response regulator [Caulobacteraceae bacterium]|nr:response regulator [Caulobacteraceae bacterium]
MLVVEDDPDLLEVIDATLRSRGFDVWPVANDLSAYQVLEQEGGSISVLIADVDIGPDTSGFDVAERARSLNPGIGVIYFTGRPLDSTKLTVADGVVCMKPFDLNRLADLVGALVAGERPGPSPLFG